MKKIIIMLISILIVIMICDKKEYNLTEDMIRFRVISNSNSIKDIRMKELVVEELSKILFNDNNDNIDSKRSLIINNMNKIENKITDLFKTKEYNNTFNISYGMNHFPEKKYNGTIFPEGEYESLVVEIGEGKGNNYWCILYPPLCMIDEDNNNIEYKSKIVEMLKNLF